MAERWPRAGGDPPLRPVEGESRAEATVSEPGADPEGRSGEPSSPAVTPTSALVPASSAPADAAEPPFAEDPVSAMSPHLGGLAKRFADRFFGGFALDDAQAERMKSLERAGAVVYVMRYSSRLDYLLFNWLFLRHQIRLSVFANGVRSVFFRPLGEALRIASRALAGRLRVGLRGVRQEQLETARAAVREGQSLFLFLRTHRLPVPTEQRREAVAEAQREVDFLREIVAECYESRSEVALIPLALFWRKGASKEPRRFNDVLYGSPERPTPTVKLLSFLFGYRNLAVRVGFALDLRSFAEARRDALDQGNRGVERVVRQVRRALLIFLRREEKPVLGATLRSRSRTQEAVLADPEVRSVIEAVAASEQRSLGAVRSRAVRYLREIAAHPNSTVIALLDLGVTWLAKRLFARVEVTGLERVVEAAKLRPLVLVPSHRSHFDYLLLSWLFYENHLAPPLVAAGANLAFWPLGPIYRRAGAFFLRRSFEGDRLYTAVFRSYTQMLIKDGITQEFFIEGTRSRTGKTLQPRLGMLGMVLDAFRRGVRRDVFIVPVGFSYERLVEESTMTEEKQGARKVQESLAGLLRARSALRTRCGEVWVRFGEPISLAEFAGQLSGMDAGDGDPAVQRNALRAISSRLGEGICRHINQLLTVGGSRVTAAVLLGRPERAVRWMEFRVAVEELALLIRQAQVPLSASLEEALAAGEPERAAQQLLESGLVARRERRGGELISFPEASREALNYYRNGAVPALAVPAALALVLCAPGHPSASEKDVLDRADSWLRLLRGEYFPPPLEERRERLVAVAGHFAERGWLRREDGQVQVLPEGWEWFELLGGQIRPTLENYRALFAAARQSALPLSVGELSREASAALEDHLLLGEARYPEAVCPTTTSNALRALIEEEILVADGNPRRSITQLDRGARWGALDEWLSRLARALG